MKYFLSFLALAFSVASASAQSMGYVSTSSTPITLNASNHINSDLSQGSVFVNLQGNQYTPSITTWTKLGNYFNLWATNQHFYIDSTVTPQNESNSFQSLYGLTGDSTSGNNRHFAVGGVYIRQNAQKDGYVLNPMPNLFVSSTCASFTACNTGYIVYIRNSPTPISHSPNTVTNLATLKNVKHIYQGNYMTIMYELQGVKYKRIYYRSAYNVTAQLITTPTVAPVLATCDPDGVQPQNCTCEVKSSSYSSPNSDILWKNSDGVVLSTSLFYYENYKTQNIPFNPVSTMSRNYRDLRTTEGKNWYTPLIDPLVARWYVTDADPGIATTGTGFAPVYDTFSSSTWNNLPIVNQPAPTYSTGQVSQLPTPPAGSDARFVFSSENTPFTAVRFKKAFSETDTGIKYKIQFYSEKISFTNGLIDGLGEEIGDPIEIPQSLMHNPIYVPDGSSQAMSFVVTLLSTPTSSRSQLNIGTFSIATSTVVKGLTVCTTPELLTATSAGDLSSAFSNLFSSTLGKIPIIGGILEFLIKPLEDFIRDTLTSLFRTLVGDASILRTFDPIPAKDDQSGLVFFLPRSSDFRLQDVNVPYTDIQEYNDYSLWQDQKWSGADAVVGFFLSIFYHGSKIVVGLIFFIIMSAIVGGISSIFSRAFGFLIFQGYGQYSQSTQAVAAAWFYPLYWSAVVVFVLFLYGLLNQLGAFNPIVEVTANVFDFLDFFFATSADLLGSFDVFRAFSLGISVSLFTVLLGFLGFWLLQRVGKII